MTNARLAVDRSLECRFINAPEVRRLTPWPQLIDALAGAYRELPIQPERTKLEVAVPGGPSGILLTMPAYRINRFVGVKLVTIFPGNRAIDAAAVSGIYALFCARTGRLLAAIDSGELTARRTAAVSALASTFLSRPDSRTLLMLGAGHIAPSVIAAHCAVRPIDRVLIWTRTRGKASALAGALDLPGVSVEAVDTIAAGLRQADIVSAATLATEPLLRGAEIRAGTHVDLIGGFTPQMRESDDDLIRMSRVYADVASAALAEAGDLIQPIATGAFSVAALVGDLHGLVGGTVTGRTEASDVTFFKSVGVAAADLAAAELVWSSDPQHLDLPPRDATKRSVQEMQDA